MAFPGPSIGPWQLAEIDVHILNEIFRQIEEQISLLRGLRSSVTVNSSGVGTATITIGQHTHSDSITGGQLSHDSALTDISTDDHHTKSHIHSSDGSGTVDGANVTYTPSDNDKWTNTTDPGALTDAINQLAQRVAELERAAEASSHERIADQLFAGSGLTFTESDESGAITITVP